MPGDTDRYYTGFKRVTVENREQSKNPAFCFAFDESTIYRGVARDVPSVDSFPLTPRGSLTPPRSDAVIGSLGEGDLKASATRSLLSVKYFTDKRLLALKHFPALEPEDASEASHCCLRMVCAAEARVSRSSRAS